MSRFPLNTSSLSPSAWSGSQDIHRDTYRIFCVLAGVLNPLFGVAYHAVDPTVVDPLWMRLVLSVLLLLLLSLSYMVRWVERNFIVLVRAYFYLLMTYVTGLVTINHFAADYTQGMLFAFTGMGVAFSLGLHNRIRPLTGYLLYTIVASFVAALLVQEPEVNVWIVWGCVISTALVIYVVANAKIRAEGAAEASERRYHTLMHAANDAILIADPDEGTLVDANQMGLDLLGRTLEEIRRMPLADIFPAHDRERALALFEAYVFERVPLTEVLFIETRDGRAVATDVSASLIDVEGKKYIQGIFRDATERHRYEDQLIEAKERAEELLRLKATLFNNMSHELRTPITSIIGFAEVISDEAEGEQREHASHIVASARRLYETFNSVLGFAQLEGGESLLDVKPIRTAEPLEEVIPQLRARAEDKGLILRLVDRAGSAHVEADGAGLKRILGNLVGNAIKFTERGEIEVEVSASAERVFIRVRDTGVGIASSFLPRVFDEFQQESNGLDRSHDGSGLGLAITRRLVDLMGGTIEVESEKGLGSIFTVAFPRVPDAEKPSSTDDGSPIAWVSDGAPHLRRIAVK